MFDWTKDPHRRFNPLTREWVLVSPHRTERPWQGQMEAEAVAAQPDYDAGARVARTQIAAGVVIGLRGDGLCFHLPLPGTLRAVRRNQHPFARQRIEPAVRIFRPVEHEPLW